MILQSAHFPLFVGPGTHHHFAVITSEVKGLQGLQGNKECVAQHVRNVGSNWAAEEAANVVANVACVADTAGVPQSNDCSIFNSEKLLFLEKKK